MILLLLNWLGKVHLKTCKLIISGALLHLSGFHLNLELLKVSLGVFPVALELGKVTLKVLYPSGIGQLVHDGSFDLGGVRSHLEHFLVCLVHGFNLPLYWMRLNSRTETRGFNVL